MAALLRTVPFAVTEEALKLLYSTHADFDKLPPPIRRGRIGAGSRGRAVLGAYDFGQVRAQSEYLRLVSIVESFVDTMSTDLFTVKTSGMTIFFQRLADAAVAQAASGWDDRKGAFLTYHNVPLGDCAKYSDVDAAVVVRNAIAHGLGGLTRRQRNKKDQGKILGAGVHLRDDRLHIDDTALTRCLASCAAFVADVDRRTPR